MDRKAKITLGNDSTRKIHFKTKKKGKRKEGNPNDARIASRRSNDDKFKPKPRSNPKKFGGYKKAISEYENIKLQKERAREDALRRKNETQMALEKYKQRKKAKFKKLSAKTKKGQPIMKNRIEMLLEKIQSMR